MKLIILSLLFFSTPSIAQVESSICWNDSVFFPGEFQVTVDPSALSTSNEVFQLLNDFENHGFSIAGVRNVNVPNKIVQHIGIWRRDYQSQMARDPDTGIYYPDYIQQNDQLIQALQLKHPSIIKVKCVHQSGGSIRVGG